jgi:hypothetical protein
LFIWAVRAYNILYNIIGIDIIRKKRERKNVSEREKRKKK